MGQENHISACFRDSLMGELVGPENPCVSSSILGGATNKNKGLRQKRDPFSLSEIDYNVTTKGSE